MTMGTGHSDVNFTNSYGKKLCVAYMRRDFSACQDCDGIWDVLGWIILNPGETKSRANPSKNRWFYYYAEAVDGVVWAGPHVAEVSHEKFEKCTCLGVTVFDGPQLFRDVGFRALDNATYTGVNFIVGG